MRGADERDVDRRRPDDPGRLRGLEIDAAIRESKWRAARRADVRRTLLESAALLGLVMLLLAGLRPWPLAFALFVAGPLAGVAIHASRSGRATTGLIGAVAYACCVPATFQIGIVGLVLGTAPAFLTFAIYGLRREFRAYAGWE